MSDEQEIVCVQFQHDNLHEEYKHCVGVNGITRIEEFPMNGLHCDIPYIRVWRGDEKVAEFCRHNVIGIWFKTSIDYPF